MSSIKKAEQDPLPAAAAGTSLCWLLDDGRPGHLRQSRGLARALGIHRQAQAILLPAALQCAAEIPEYPGQGLLIGCGRRSALCSRRIRRGNRARWANIQILDPRGSRDKFDWILAPEHDRLAGPNSIRFCGALSEVDDDFLNQAPGWDPQARGMHAPGLVMLVGGPISQLRWAAADLRNWLDELAWQTGRLGCRAAVLDSRRTPAWASRLIRENLPDNTRFFSHSEPDNPYATALSCADQLWVTADSVSMLADACATRRPVRALGTTYLVGKHRGYIGQLTGRGRLLESWRGAIPDQWLPVREAGRVAATLRLRGALLGIEQLSP